MRHTEESGVEVTETGTQLALTGGGATTGSFVSINPHAVPRLALDRIIASHFTLGLGASYYSQTADWEAERYNESVSGDGLTSWLVAFSPRVGYVEHVGDSAGVWLRAGLTWSQQRSHNPLVYGDVKVATVDISLSWVQRVIGHLGVVATVDAGLPAGGTSRVDYDTEYAQYLGVPAYREYDIELSVIALQAGILAYF